ncbi:MAG: hypothetical protein AB2795_19980 [Candidatus Thiodiazotropha endolucinida]
MKLPRKDDPAGKLEASLPREKVLAILFENNIDIVHQDDGTVLLEKDEISIAQSLPPVILGDLVKYLARQFDIDITDFYFKTPEGLH